MGMFFEKEPL